MQERLHSAHKHVLSGSCTKCSPYFVCVKRYGSISVYPANAHLFEGGTDAAAEHGCCRLEQTCRNICSARYTSTLHPRWRPLSSHVKSVVTIQHAEQGRTAHPPPLPSLLPALSNASPGITRSSNPSEVDRAATQACCQLVVLTHGNSGQQAIDTFASVHNVCFFAEWLVRQSAMKQWCQILHAELVPQC